MEKKYQNTAHLLGKIEEMLYNGMSHRKIKISVTKPKHYKKPD